MTAIDFSIILKPLILACNASPYQQEALLSHIMEDGSERPIAFASRTLSKSRTKLFTNRKGEASNYFRC